ncbi:MAG: phosphate acyltransferase [Salinivirgaceae bacterium]|nr:phosphate acyltransferase [Salinivirgaceae bacterium]MDD4747494.1 phosphate acyltransferase [Salinivirgaceae bacterium]MDY0280671.1 phosphate acyltransferase [Salinivirgaceae bacterium]
MEPITKLSQIVDHLLDKQIKKRVAVACAQDQNTIGALAQAVENGFAEAIMIGDQTQIERIATLEGIDPTIFTIIHLPNMVDATLKAVEMVRNNEADVLMKGLVGTDKFLKAVLDKQKGLLPEKAVMSYVAAIELPKYHKLLFVTDTAVIPYPDLKQKSAMLKYSIDMAHKFGIETPKVALIGSAEKVSPSQQYTVDYAMMCKMVERGQLPKCIIDGPLDVFLACDPKSVEIKGVPTPVNGDADVLLFPSLESCNSFYKGLMLFGEGELAGLIQGTIKPVVVMSRSESSTSKFYCVALACLMA